MNTETSRTWLITGSSSGFGRSLAGAALAHGDNVVATARRPEALDQLVAAAPDRVLAAALDVTRPETITAAVAAAVARFGRVDVVVNNAGYGSVGAVEEIEPAELRALIETMFYGAVAVTQAVLPQMRAQGAGQIVQISSMGGQVSPAGFGAYCAAKGALEAISGCLAAEVAAFGIDVMIVEPGAFRTEFGGARMHRSRDIGVYGKTVGATRAYVDGMDGSQPGDPDRAAAAVIAALASGRAPLRLALGSDAVDAIRDELSHRLAELDAWEPTSRSTELVDR